MKRPNPPSPSAPSYEEITERWSNRWNIITGARLMAANFSIKISFAVITSRTTISGLMYFPPPPPFYYRENNKEARKGWELVRAWKRFLYFLSYRRFLRNYWSLITCKLHETRWYLEWSFSFPFASRGIVRLNNKERERKIVRRMKLNYVWTIFFISLNVSFKKNSNLKEIMLLYREWRNNKFFFTGKY